MENNKNFKCYAYQRSKWFSPFTSSPQVMQVIELVYPEWLSYEEQYLKKLKETYE